MFVLLDGWYKNWSTRGTYVHYVRWGANHQGLKKSMDFTIIENFYWKAEMSQASWYECAEYKNTRVVIGMYNFRGLNVRRNFLAIVSTHCMWSSEVSHNMIQRLYNKMKVCVNIARIEYGWLLQECEQPFCDLVYNTEKSTDLFPLLDEKYQLLHCWCNRSIYFRGCIYFRLGAWFAALL